MSGKYLLDTNIIIALFAKETVIIESLARAEEVFIPSIAIGEYITVLENQEELKITYSVLMN